MNLLTGKQIVELCKGVMVPPKKQYYLGRIKYFTPYFFPMNFCKTILWVRKLVRKTPEQREEYLRQYVYATSSKNATYNNYPMVTRSYHKIVKLFKNEYYVEWGWPIKWGRNYLGYKTKWTDTDYRFEWVPMFYIFFFNWQFTIHWMSPFYKEEGFHDNYYEQFLLLRHYDMDVEHVRQHVGKIDEKYLI